MVWGQNLRAHYSPQARSLVIEQLILAFQPLSFLWLLSGEVCMPARGSEDVRWPGIISMCSLPQAHYILTECFLCWTNGTAAAQAIS